MKELDKLITSLNKRIDMHIKQSVKFQEKGEQENSAYNDGMAEGIRYAIEEIEKANTSINIKLNNL